MPTPPRLAQVRRSAVVPRPPPRAHFLVSLGFDSRDLVLDVVVDDDLSSCRLKDADELAFSVDVGKFTATEAFEIHRTAQAVIAEISARAWPFDEDAWETFEPDPAWPTPPLPDGWADRFDGERRFRPGQR